MSESFKKLMSRAPWLKEAALPVSQQDQSYDSNYGNQPIRAPDGTEESNRFQERYEQEEEYAMEYAFVSLKGETLKMTDQDGKMVQIQLTPEQAKQMSSQIPLEQAEIPPEEPVTPQGPSLQEWFQRRKNY